MDGTVLLGVLKVAAIALVPVAVMAAFLHAAGAHDRVLALGRRMHLLRPPPEPLPRSLERLAADLRRLGPEVRSPRPGIAMARHRGIVAAYDGILVATAAALDVPTALAEIPEGLDHEAERMRLEHALAAAGISW